MNEFLSKILYHNTIGSYLLVSGIILAAYFIRNFLSKYLAAVILRFFIRDKFLKKEKFFEYIIEPLGLFIFSLTVIIALAKLKMPPEWDIKIYSAITLHKVLEGLASASLIILFTRLCIRFMLFIALLLENRANTTDDKTDNQLVIFFRDFFKVLLNIVGALLLLRFVFNYDISKLVTGLSIVGAALALATKESLENLIASFIIFFDKPFTAGDLVKVQGFMGTVEKIGLRSTRIRTDHKTYITVPNKQMVDSIMDNITLRTQRRGELILELDLQTTPVKLRALVQNIKKILEKLAAENTTVYLSNTGKNAHVVSIEYFFGMEESFEDFVHHKEDINLQVISLLHESEIKLAGGATTVVIRDPAV